MNICIKLLSKIHIVQPPINSLITTFSLSGFNQFTTLYKQTNNHLASEVLLAFEQFLLALNKFFNLFEDLAEEMVTSNTTINWYSYTTAASSGDYIHASRTP